MAVRSNEFPSLHLLLSILFCFILLGLSFQNKVSLINTPINFLLTPLRAPFVAINQITTQNIQNLKQFPHQTRLIKDLQRQNATLSIEANKAKLLEQENQSLKSQINAPNTISRPLLPTKVIGISRYAYLNQGSSNNIKPGLAVIIDNILVGVVISTTSSTSKVRLLADPETNISATTLSQTTGTLIFREAVLKLDQVLQKKPLTINEPIFTKGSELIPDGLLIGTITEIHENQASVYKDAFIKPSTNIADQQTVFVVLE